MPSTRKPSSEALFLSWNLALLQGSTLSYLLTFPFHVFYLPIFSLSLFLPSLIFSAPYRPTPVTRGALCQQVRLALERRSCL